MKHHYTGLWALLATAFAIFAATSALDTISVFGHEFKSSGIYRRLTQERAVDVQAPARDVSAAGSTQLTEPGTQAAASFPMPTDTTSKTILFIGDSMLEGLSPRLAAYCEKNGHTLYSVIWYSSTSEVWGRSGKLASYIERLHPDYVFICLGANELFVRDIKEKRDKYVKQIVAETGGLPFLWIGPPNWKPDTGINELIEANVPQGSFFLSDGMHFDRSKDGAHPTRASAALWMDSVARWMPAHSNHPIKMSRPTAAKGRAKRIFTHQPNEQ